MSENIMLGDIVKTRNGDVGIFESINDGQYVIKCMDGTHKTDKISHATTAEIKRLCKNLLTKEPLT